ncbi:MAG: hypothetical protein EXR76_04505 [Myxococcales bacterium]|nr:hypothetical protein [Myxococcales bacterium]
MTDLEDLRRRMLRIVDPRTAEANGRAQAVPNAGTAAGLPEASPNAGPAQAPADPLAARRLLLARRKTTVDPNVGTSTLPAHLRGQEAPAPAPTPTPTPTVDAPLSPLASRLGALLRSAGRAPVKSSAAPGGLAGGPSDHYATLARAFDGEVRETAQGRVFVAVNRYTEDDRHAGRPLLLLREPPPEGAAALGLDLNLRSFSAHSALFLDLETTGLGTNAGTLPFLIGTAHFRRGELLCEQWLLGSPDDEEAALTGLSERLRGADFLVTFNGRSFDLPLLQARFRLHRLDDPSLALEGHLDLLPASRRLLKAELSNCRLTTIERELLGLHRRDDVPGAEVPGRYRDWLRSGDPSSLAGVLEHNRLDVLSMVSLLDELLLRVSEPASLFQRDPVGAIRLAERARRLGLSTLAARFFEAGRCFAEAEAACDSGLRRLERAQRRRLARARKTVGENNNKE